MKYEIILCAGGSDGTTNTIDVTLSSGDTHGTVKAVFKGVPGKSFSVASAEFPNLRFTQRLDGISLNFSHEHDNFEFGCAIVTDEYHGIAYRTDVDNSVYYWGQKIQKPLRRIAENTHHSIYDNHVFDIECDVGDIDPDVELWMKLVGLGSTSTRLFKVDTSSWRGRSYNSFKLNVKEVLGFANEGDSLKEPTDLFLCTSKGSISIWSIKVKGDGRNVNQVDFLPNKMGEGGKPFVFLDGRVKTYEKPTRYGKTRAPRSRY